MEYDRSGRSNGQAVVQFGDRQDAVLAMDRFHNIPLDGLPMRIRTVEVPRPAAAAGDGPRRSDGRWGHSGFHEQSRGRRPAPGPRRREETTADMLDNDLDAYMMQK